MIITFPKLLELMVNIYDHQEFLSKAPTPFNMIYISPLKYYREVGLYLVCKELYPDVPVEQSYQKIIEDNIIPSTPQQSTDKTCCGGGKVI